MKFFHTADWHLGKIIQGMRMTEDQDYILKQFIRHIEAEKPDAIIIAGDLYDRQVPPTEAVQLLNDVLEDIVIRLKIPVLAIGGNHDSPSRLNFANKMMTDRGLHLVGALTDKLEPVILHDDHGPVHFHLIPYADPSQVGHTFQDDSIKTHDDAYKLITNKIKEKMNEGERHVFIGHAFVTPYGEEKENTSESERPLSIGGAEYVRADLFSDFHYTALGHLHRAHSVRGETIRYSGSPLKYSISEEKHKKGFLIVELDETGEATIEKKELLARRDLYTVKGELEDLLTHDICHDYVFVHLLDETTVLSPMEKIRSVYPNAMHISRENIFVKKHLSENKKTLEREKMTDLDLFKAFYEEVKGIPPSTETEQVFVDVLDGLLKKE